MGYWFTKIFCLPKVKMEWDTFVNGTKTDNLAMKSHIPGIT